MAEGEVEFPLRAVPRMGRRRVMYVPNHRSFGAFMRSDQMRDVTEEVAHDIALRAAALTPEGGGPQSRGLHDRVRGGFTVKRNGGFLKVSGNLRVQVLVENNEEGSALVEFGAKNIARARMLGTAGAEFGDFHTWREED